MKDNLIKIKDNMSRHEKALARKNNLMIAIKKMNDENTIRSRTPMSEDEVKEARLLIKRILAGETIA